MAQNKCDRQKRGRERVFLLESTTSFHEYGKGVQLFNTIVLFNAIESARSRFGVRYERTGNKTKKKTGYCAAVQ